MSEPQDSIEVGKGGSYSGKPDGRIFVKFTHSDSFEVYWQGTYPQFCGRILKSGDKYGWEPPYMDFMKHNTISHELVRAVADKLDELNGKVEE